MFDSDLKLKLAYKSVEFLNLTFNLIRRSELMPVDEVLKQAYEGEQNQVLKLTYRLMRSCKNPENTIRILNNFAESTYSEDLFNYHSCRMFIEIYSVVLKGNPEIVAIVALSYLGIDFKEEFVEIVTRGLTDDAYKYYFDEDGDFNFNLVLL